MRNNLYLHLFRLTNAISYFYLNQIVEKVTKKCKRKRNEKLYV